MQNLAKIFPDWIDQLIQLGILIIPIPLLIAISKFVIKELNNLILQAANGELAAIRERLTRVVEQRDILQKQNIQMFDQVKQLSTDLHEVHMKLVESGKKIDKSIEQNVILDQKVNTVQTTIDNSQGLV